MSKLDDVTKAAAEKTAALYASGDATRIAVFEALQRQKAIARGDSPEQAIMALDALRRMGAGLNEEERANAHSGNETVELNAATTAIAENLAASGKTPEQIADTLATLKQVGALFVNNNITQAQNNAVTPVNVPNVAAKTNDLPDF